MSSSPIDGLLPVAVLPGQVGEAGRDNDEMRPASGDPAGAGEHEGPGEGEREEPGGVDGAATPPRSPIRTLAGSLLGAFARKPRQTSPAAAAAASEESAQEATGYADLEETDENGAADEHGANNGRPKEDTEAQPTSPLDRFTGAFRAALRSISPPRTVGSESVGSDGPRGPNSLPAASPYRSPIASARSVPEQ